MENQQKKKPIMFMMLLVMSLEGYAAQMQNDYHALVAFKASSDKTNKLATWTHKNPCRRRWYGVDCENGRVVRIVLENLELVGSIQALTALDELRILSLKKNSFTGPLPDLSNWRSLKLLFLSQNHFSGPLPLSVSSSDHLVRLDVSGNELSGQIPVTLASLTHLLTLRLDNNEFSGDISELMLPTTLEVFNVSGNRLSGIIPASLSKFPSSSFGSNGGLCGNPLYSCNSSISNTSNSNAGTDVTPPGANNKPSMISNPLPSPKTTHYTKLSKGNIVAIVVGDVAVLLLIACLVFCYYWRNQGDKNKARVPKTKVKRSCEKEKPAHDLNQCSNQPQTSTDKCKLVFFEDRRPFELEHLLRASAEMLGKGNFGSAYKAIMEDGSVVAVKRLKDVHGVGRKEFEQHMEVVGKLRHQNVVNLRAYYYAKEEKLLVYDYMPNGSLYALLHGSRGPGRTALDWTTRMKIALGAARGLAFIHDYCKSPKIGHGNIKSSNILLDRSGNACISDFGLALLVSPSVAALRMVGYRAPEQAATKKISQKADVYSFGVLLLEILTGKAPFQTQTQEEGIDLPRWVQSVVREEWTSEVFDIELMRFKNIEEELVSMLHTAMLCTSQSPQQRPKMSHVVKLIQEIGAQQSPMEDPVHSIAESPSVSEDSGIRSI
ncbi:hypothetical protein SUGI_0443070 [Cryptomeria japonica]|uniref:probable leucine-rich repeat receptor-like protein kinase At1g68400 n=1 Tax=Cryptomeria japonica TaxID=3369 RepID=UPI0024089E7F|nr:probable leucine-rich repeat receptor-like protein kinase At1g68400 [Cryptomeria japonica]GLJ23412.1 hypothetical protein SUGI_0443070 [Cryptomeria japonica]